MKRLLLLLVLAVASAGTPLFAQTYISGGLFLPPPSQLFDAQKPGTLRSGFDFLLHNGNRLSLELNHVTQLQSLTNLDSILKQVWKTLQPFADSFTTPLVSRRVDYYQTALDTRIRLLQYPQKGAVYRIKGSDTAQLKLEQDTLRIRLFTKRDIVIGKNKSTIEQSYFVTLYLNNITDLPTIQASDLDWALTTLKSDLGRNLYESSDKRYYQRYYAVYNVVQQKKTAPFKGISPINSRRQFVTPYMQVGLQYVRGTWAPSIGPGLELVRRITTNQEQHFILLWEPYFFFRDNAAAGGNVRMDRNDFVTFKYKYNVFSNTNKKDLSFANNTSISYLVNREGQWFEAHTFKFTVPGLQTKNILLEPEFFFNDFFKQFSPSLKLVLVFE